MTRSGGHLLSQQGAELHLLRFASQEGYERPLHASLPAFFVRAILSQWLPAFFASPREKAPGTDFTPNKGLLSTVSEAVFFPWWLVNLTQKRVTYVRTDV